MFIDIDLGSGATPQLEAVLAEISAGDTLVSPSVDFMTRSIVGLLDIHSKLDAKGAALRVLQLAGGMPLDTSTAEGRAILGALAVMSALPQPMPVAVQQGEAKSASAPAFVASAATLAPTSPQTFTGLLPSRPRGRPATAVGQAHEVTRLRSQGLRAVEIAAHLGIGRASVYRILSQSPMGDASAPGTDRASLSARVLAPTAH
jgi:DNA invertase Pin-like site-specific DNA recombinase